MQKPPPRRVLLLCEAVIEAGALHFRYCILICIPVGSRAIVLLPLCILRYIAARNSIYCQDVRYAATGYILRFATVYTTLWQYSVVSDFSASQQTITKSGQPNPFCSRFYPLWHWVVFYRMAFCIIGSENNRPNAR